MASVFCLVLNGFVGLLVEDGHGHERHPQRVGRIVDWWGPSRFCTRFTKKIAKNHSATPKERAARALAVARNHVSPAPAPEVPTRVMTRPASPSRAVYWLATIHEKRCFRPPNACFWSQTASPASWSKPFVSPLQILYSTPLKIGHKNGKVRPL